MADRFRRQSEIEAASSIMRAYFDDSGTHSDGRSKMVVCGGVVVSDEQHDHFTQEWSTILGRKGLPFFHFTKFKAHRLPPYCDMTTGEREILLMQLLLAIRVRIRFSFSGAVPVSVYEATLTAEEKRLLEAPIHWRFNGRG